MGAAMRRMSGRALRQMLRLLAPLFPAQIPVLTYHSVDDSGSAISVGHVELQRQLRELRAHDWRSLSIDEYCALASENRVRKRRVLITFDDGYPSFHKHALPLLLELGFTATVFVCTDFVGRTPDWLARDAGLMHGMYDRYRLSRSTRARLDRTTERLRPQPLMDWPQLRELVEAGIDVQSHGASHRFLTTLPQAELADDLARSRRVLEDNLSCRVRAIAYPYGDCDERVAQAARDAGFDCGFVTDQGQRAPDKLMCWRAGVGTDTGNAELRALLETWPLYPTVRNVIRGWR